MHCDLVVNAMKRMHCMGLQQKLSYILFLINVVASKAKLIGKFCEMYKLPPLEAVG